MPLLIRNGRIVTATDDTTADVYCAGESITRVEPAIDPASVRGAEIIDAAGKLVFPGFIDPHVHVHLPFMGTHAKDDWRSASRAALLGGTTTLIEMICPSRADDALEAFETWAGKAEHQSACDYGFHMGVTRFDESTPSQLRAIVERGVPSFKVFLAYRGALGIDDRELYRTLRLARELGVIVTAHCENETLVAERQLELLAAGRGGPESHEASRPVAVEAEGVHHLMTFAELTGAHVYVVHTSCAPALAEARRAIDRGVRAWVEVVIPHLVLDKTAAERGGFDGAKFVMSPPLRDRSHQEALWEGLRSGLVSTVGTDHAPFDFRGQKTMGRGDFTRIPNGIPSVQHRVELLYTHGVAAGRIDLRTFVGVASAHAARIFGLAGKGTIAPGADADLVVWDPDHRGTISAKTHAMATDYSAFEGFEVRGRASLVTVRGEVAVRDGRFTGTPGRGRLLRRAPTHFQR